MQATPKRNKSMGCLPSILECCFTIPSYHMQPTCIPLRPRHLNFQRSWVTKKIMESHMTSSHPNLFEQFSFTSFIHQSAKTHHSAMDLSRHQHRKVQEVRPAESWLENPVTMTSPFHHPSDGATKKHKLFSAKSLFRILRVLIVVEHLDPSKPPPGLKLISKT